MNKITLSLIFFMVSSAVLLTACSSSATPVALTQFPIATTPLGTAPTLAPAVPSSTPDALTCSIQPSAQVSSPSELGIAPPETSVLEIIDQTYSIGDCDSANLSQIRNEVPLFHISLLRELSLEGKEIPQIGVYKFDDNGLNKVINFTTNLKSPEWYSELENAKYSTTAGENYSSVIQKGLESLEKTGAKNQELLLVTDGSYLTSAVEEKSHLLDVLQNKKGNQHVSVLLLCPHANPKKTGAPELSAWSNINKLGIISLFATYELDTDPKYDPNPSIANDPDWLQNLTSQLFGDYIQPLQESGFLHTGSTQQVTPPLTLGDAYLHAILLSPNGSIKLDPGGVLGDGDVQNSRNIKVAPDFSNGSCSTEHTISNFSMGDTYYWVEGSRQKKVDVSIKVISGDPDLELQTSLKLSAGDMINNIMPCLMPRLTALVQDTQGSPLKQVPVDIVGQRWVSDFNNRELITNWVLRDTKVIPTYFNYYIVDATSKTVPGKETKEQSAYYKQIVPTTFLHKPHIDLESNGNWMITLPVWFPDFLDTSSLSTVQAKTDLAVSDLPGGCPSPLHGDGQAYKIPNSPSTTSTQSMIYRWLTDPINKSVCNLQIELNAKAYPPGAPGNCQYKEFIIKMRTTQLDCQVDGQGGITCTQN